MLEALHITADDAPSLTQSELIDADTSNNVAETPKLIELMQVSFTKAYAAHFTLFGSHFLSVHTKHLFRRPSNYWVDLRYVDPMPLRTRVIDRPALWTTGILALISAIAFLISWLSVNSLFWIGFAAPLTCLTLISGLTLAQRSKHRIVFCSRYGRTPWFELMLSKPRRRVVDAFIETLTTTIHKAASERIQGEGGKLGAELREQRRLKDAGILSEQIYKSVKARLLKQHA